VLRKQLSNVVVLPGKKASRPPVVGGSF